MSWRCLTYIRSQNPRPKDESEVALKDAAEKHLRAYLLGEADNLLQYEQHLIPLEAIHKTSMTDMPPSMNRYLLRAIAMDIIGNNKSKFIYTKLPSFILLGVLDVANIKDMRSSRVALKSGQISPRQYILPAGFQGYLYDKANQMTELHRTIPQKHLDSFDKHIRANPEKTVKSKQFQAFLHDYNRFGDDVFDRPVDIETSIVKPTKEG
ncbi:hypothetical protein [Methylophilus sp. QUAN]|uniref:hypothetical protein n=1 Tax=Methylophilus sp. QUAN TaxID=2781020 RepID=UPI001E4A4FE2|nr:hypothetical protein [Methylophilus sp. QUAN]